eukprot:364637-Chlamydomonas_euryale.AAC.5
MLSCCLCDSESCACIWYTWRCRALTSSVSMQVCVPVACTAVTELDCGKRQAKGQLMHMPIGKPASNAQAGALPSPRA